MQCQSFADLLHTLLKDSCQHFELTQTVLILLDPHYEIRRLLITNEIAFRQKFPNLFFLSKKEKIIPLMNSNFSPRLGPYQTDLHSKFFQSSQRKHCSTVSPLIHSVATLPLVQEPCAGKSPIGLSDFW